MVTSQNNLPVQPNPIIGREKEIDELLNLLSVPQNRLITLHGFGGSGKTRLAIEIGLLDSSAFADGVWLVALAPLNSPDQLLTSTTSALGFTFGSPENQKQQLFNYLSGKKLLLIFDNLEHLLPDAKFFIEDILQNTSHIRMLVTSRQPLNSAWEWVYPLRGLAYQENELAIKGKRPAAAELFLQHLRRGGQQVGEKEAACAGQVSRLVNGLPLALLLAASWGRALGCDQIVQEIKQGIGFLTTRQVKLDDRHNSMQTVFDYSWRLLSANEKTVLQTLSVFRGGFTRSACAKLSGANLAGIASLVDQSLVERVTNDRYQIHELLRQYLQSRLKEAGDEKEARDAHLAYFSKLAEQAGSELYGAHQYAWIQDLKLEIGNLNVALEWCLENPEPDRVELGLKLMVSIERLWSLPLLLNTAYAYLLRLIGILPEESSRPIYGYSLSMLGRLSYLLGNLEDSRRYTAQSIQIGNQTSDARLMADGFYSMGVEAYHRSEIDISRSNLQMALKNYQSEKFEPGIALTLNKLGRCDTYDGNFSTALASLKEALNVAGKINDIQTYYAILRSLGELALADPQIGLQKARAYFLEGIEWARQLNDILYIGYIINGLGEIARLEGKLDEAVSHYKETIAIDSELGRLDELITVELNLGFVYSQLGKVEESKELFTKNFLRAQKFDFMKIETSISLLGLAGVAEAEENFRLAANLLGFLDSIKDEILSWPTERRDYERIASGVKNHLQDHEFEACYRAGKAMDLTQVSQVISSPPPPKRPAKQEPPHGLTTREAEILRLLAQGLTDAQIAQELVISPRTVNAHLTSIYSKLGVNSRAAATRFAVENRLA